MREVMLTYLSVFGCLALYGLLRLRLISASQKYRISAAIEADDLLDDPRLNKIQRRMLISGIQRAYDTTRPWKFLLAVVQLLLRPQLRERARSELPDDPEFKKKFMRAIGRMGAATLMLSPLAIFLILVTGLLGMLVLNSVQAVGQSLLRAVERILVGPTQPQN